MNLVAILRPATLGLLAAMLVLGTAQAANRFTASSNGQTITDSQTGLVWSRCSAGQTWTGSTCSGTATTYTHAQALAYAATQTGWRLPNVKELNSLVDRDSRNPAINSATFPSTPAEPYWTASPVVSGPDGAWLVYFSYGYVSYSSRDTKLHVRLVKQQ